jgi:hypothetical protein
MRQRVGIKALGLFAIKNALSWFGHSLEFIRTSPDTKSQILGLVRENQLESLCWDINYPVMLILADQFITPYYQQIPVNGEGVKLAGANGAFVMSLPY